MVTPKDLGTQIISLLVYVSVTEQLCLLEVNVKANVIFSVV